MPTVVLDTTRLNDAESVTDWHILGSGSKATLNPDYFYQGANSISRKVGKAAIDGVEYDPAAGAVDFTTGPRTWIAKFTCTTPGLLESTGANGLSLRIGSAETDYYLYYIFTASTYPATVSWAILPIDPNLVAFRDAIVGTPSITAVDYFALQALMTASPLGENMAMDAIDYVTNGQGQLLTGTGGAYEDFRVDDEDDITNGRAGVFATVKEQNFVVGTLRIGDTGQVGFTDTNKKIVFVGGRVDQGFSGHAINVTHASSAVSLTSITWEGQGQSGVKKFFDTALEVTGGATDTVTLPGHGLSTGDYVLYSREGGVDAIGLTDATNYFVRAVDADTIAFYAVGATVGRQNSISDTSRLGLTAATAPGENHSVVRTPDNRPDLVVTGTGGTFTLTSGSIVGHRLLTLTSAATISGGFILQTGSISLSTGALDGVTVSDATLEEGAALLDPLTTLDNIDNCTIEASSEGHLARLTGTGSFTFSGNTLSGYWAPATDGWNFDTITGVDAATDVITTDALHGFTDGEAVYYNDEGLSDSVGLTDLSKYYVNALTTTTLSLHATRAAAIADSSRINLSDGALGQTHSLYSGRAAIFNDSGGAVTINVTDGSTPSIRNGSLSTTVVQNTVTLSVTVLDTASDPINLAQVAIYRSSDDAELMNEDTNVSGLATEPFAYLSDTDVYIRVRKSSTGSTRYYPGSTVGTVTASGLTVTVTLQVDTIAST